MKMNYKTNGYGSVKEIRINKVKLVMNCSCIGLHLPPEPKVRKELSTDLLPKLQEIIAQNNVNFVKQGVYEVTNFGGGC